MFLAFGEVMARIAPAGHHRWRQAVPGQVEVTWGGGEANVSASLALFGNATRYLTALPRHAISEALVATLRGLGVDTERILWRADGRLGLYFVEVGANQRGSTVLYDRAHSAISQATAEEYDFAAALEGVHWLHVTGITPAISRAAFESNLALLKAAKEAGVTVSCDLNFRKKLWRWREGVEPRALARECMAATLPFVDVVIGNEEDASDVLDIHAAGSDATRGKIDSAGYVSVAQQICERYANVSHVAITLRESISADHNNWGAMLYVRSSDTPYFAPVDESGDYVPYRIHDIVDRVGAGDSFAAGLLHRFNQEPDAPQAVIDFAVAASCLKHSVHGDFNFVSEQEVLALAGGNRSGRVQR